MIKKQIINAAKLAIRSSVFAPSLRRITRAGPLVKAIETGKKIGWDRAADWLISQEGKAILDNPEFHSSLRRIKNLDIETEFLLTALRKKLLSIEDQQLDNPIIQETICSLIYQSFINEYVWYVSDEETQILTENLKLIDDAGNPQSISWQIVARLAMYHRLNDILPGQQSIKQEVKLLDNPCHCFKNFIEEYAADYDEDIEIKSSIESFGSIENVTSKKIARNYEEYPYPRWDKLEKSHLESRQKKLLKLFSEDDLSFMDKPFNVLVAGCGTGYGAIEYALSYNTHAQITAVDLSRASLAYATKMSRRYGVKNVKFLQMDLLDLPKLDLQFDIVECTGVLHHMKDPVEGGKALVSRVRAGGIVHISLYSELARQQIVTFRSAYNLDPGMSDDEVREYRYRIMVENEGAIEEKLSLRADFFDLNRCRDLLFHPLEHRFTVPKIAHLLDELGLEFMGFERPEIIRTRYWTHYPSKKDWRNLNRWDEFEHKHPEAFGSLYQIWAKKI